MQYLASDMEHYKVDNLAVQETHLRGNGDIEVESITSNTGTKYDFYYSIQDQSQNNIKNREIGGIGFIVRKDLNVHFKKRHQY